ncbi:MAG: anaerobic sulfatase maturase [Planctomycetota bacterium]|nr:MAG: anaerobic sulfatase maturase [Planctomycetota bacterium]
MQPFTLLIKPSGSDCNLDCTYCFYKNRAPEVGQGRQRMSDEVLERLIKDYLQLGLPMAGFSWQGGEPTLMGLDFYKKVVQLQKKYGKARQHISNALQTNAILLDDEWCQFLHDNKFLVGISIDGPKEFHDYYRVDHSGSGSFDKVMTVIQRCKKYKVEFNILTLLNNKNIEHPDKLFDFFIENGIRYLQFITCLERDSDTDKVLDFSITAQQYGEFLCRIFNRWHDYGPDKLSIRDFDSILAFCVSGNHTICTFDKQCSSYIVIEHNGDAFCCDFYVEPDWRIGNIFETPIEKLATGSKKRTFARAKQNISNTCLLCRHLSFCRGGCQKDRIASDGQHSRQSYFCPSYKRFFDYAMPKFMQLAATISAGSAIQTQPFI